MTPSYKTIGTAAGATTAAIFTPKHGKKAQSIGTSVLYSAIGSASGGYVGHQIDKYRGRKSQAGTKSLNRVKRKY